ncbi:MAG: hypothetical protein QGG67_09065 [Gammaproteobacteria bacterium]|mgnify:FL=1|jgi:hypothetical protein|nr:hypothetical protein [Gammaproteobacteria bacterium]MDP6096120.1 hypothetical protein [Gammaproteobacteria bacterium]MDP7456110.1 hypothetical protein [Gammaproteobacteria bacterium]HJO12728.1 hypothetical protein [Gammaproteobacteria bacterium]
MKKTLLFTTAALLTAVASFSTINSQENAMSFFITSVGSGDGANLGGLAGADAHCSALATAAGSRGKTWRAYLSTSATATTDAVDARGRIGFGPWYNAKGVMVAENLNRLHSEFMDLGKENSLTENGDMVNGRGDTPNQHDILTGSGPDGYTMPSGTDTTCNNWTSNDEGSAMVGHFDRTGGGQRPNSFNSAHASRGCSQEDLIGTGGNGYFYCFAID